MLFNSVEFLIFFPIVVILYYIIPFRHQWLLLLAASYLFYMSWRPEYIILIIFSTLVDYFVARKMWKLPPGSTRRNYLVASIFVHLIILFSFKYFTFFSNTVRFLLGQIETGEIYSVSKVLLPVGISFYTFKSLSYTIDVYRGEQQPENHLGKFALYVSFFPQLVAGPIERAHQLLPQIYEKHGVDYDRITDGLRLMAWGFFKKLVVADRLALIVNNVYNNPTEYTGVPLIIATFFFSIQIYCDFSGYTDIALGAARVLGFDLVDNFKQPYFSKSVGEFWRRWHITLSTWFRDYVYIPLGGNRVSKWRWYANVMIVFLLSGLWHGASWTFVIWGGLHGLFLIASIILVNYRKKVYGLKPLRNSPFWTNLIMLLGTFALVTFAWIFFRANTITDALYIVTHLFTGIELMAGYGLNLGGTYNILLIMLSLLTVFVVDLIQARGGTIDILKTRPVWLRWTVYYILIFSILLFGKLGTVDFIYYQF